MGDSGDARPFEREKWEADLRLRERELALKERDEQHRLEELALKRAELGRSRWANPLVLAVVGAGLAAAGNAGVTWLNGNQQLALEGQKAEAARVFEMIKTTDQAQAIKNLEFLMSTGLIADQGSRARIQASLANLKKNPKQAPFLPSNDRGPRELVMTDLDEANVEETEKELRAEGKFRFEREQQPDGRFRLRIWRKGGTP